jgi:hypothetical protein
VRDKIQNDKIIALFIRYNDYMITDIDMMFPENLRLFVSGGGTMKDG